jgi:hypothetical protein
MATINIQEILHPSDSDRVKFEKINYNFDQIVANGGGPQGPKGPEGQKGDHGFTGDKGQKGEIGLKGESGETTSPWKSITIDAEPETDQLDVTILKPKPDTDKTSPVIWIGDNAFKNLDPADDGDVVSRTSLNVGRHYNYELEVVEGGHISLWHDNIKNITIDSEDTIDVEGNEHTRYNFTAGPYDPLPENRPDIRLQFNLPTIFDETLRVPYINQLSNAVALDGMIRYNQGADVFEGYINGTWTPFCMTPCGGGGPSPASIQISGGNLDLNPDGSLRNDTISISGSHLGLNPNGELSVLNISGGNLNLESDGTLS